MVGQAGTSSTHPRGLGVASHRATVDDDTAGIEEVGCGLVSTGGLNGRVGAVTEVLGTRQ